MNEDKGIDVENRRKNQWASSDTNSSIPERPPERRFKAG